MRTISLFWVGLVACWRLSSCAPRQPEPEEVIEIINRVNTYWQETHPRHERAFWARGNGWVLAVLAKMLKDFPETDAYRQEYVDRFRAMAKSVVACQQPEGYWTRSLLDPNMPPDRKPAVLPSSPTACCGA